MPIGVHFRGPILFVHEDHRLVEGLIPNAETPGKHADNSCAKQHFAGMLVLDKDDRFLKRVDLGGRTVSISSESTTTPTSLNTTFKEKVGMMRMVNDGAPAKEVVTLASTSVPQWDRLNTIIRINGGEIHASNKTQKLFDITSHRPSGKTTQQIPLLTSWWSKGPSVTIEIRDKSGALAEMPLALNSGEQVFIYHWDHDEPEPGKERLMEPLNAAGTSWGPDLDFRWLYRLLDPPAGQSWQDWLSQDPTGELPAPRTTFNGSNCDDAAPLDLLFPPSSACDGALWP